MKKNVFLLILGAIFGVLTYSSCEESEEDQLLRKNLIEQTYQERITKYRQSVYDKCRKSILATAKIISDSTLLDNARNIKVVDSIQRPPKPLKPGFPEPKSINDSSEVAPFLPEAPQDSIN